MYKITSKDNQIIKDLIRIRDDSKFRTDKSLFYVEGERIINDCPIEIIDKLFVNESKLDKFSDVIEKCKDKDIYILSDLVFDKIKDTVNSQGIIALVKSNLIRNYNDLNKDNLVFLIDNIQDPGNLGTILRVSEAIGVDQIIITKNSCDIFNPKVVRASMSSIFRLDIVITDDIINTIKEYKQIGYKLIATSLKSNSKKYFDADFKGKVIVAFGNEGNGISDSIINLSDETIIIPMSGNIESLNVAVSLAVIGYEAKNKRENVN